MKLNDTSTINMKLDKKKSVEGENLANKGK